MFIVTKPLPSDEVELDAVALIHFGIVLHLLILRHLLSTLGQKIQSVFVRRQKLGTRWRGMHDRQLAVTRFGVRQHLTKTEWTSDRDLGFELDGVVGLFHFADAGGTRESEVR